MQFLKQLLFHCHQVTLSVLIKAQSVSLERNHIFIIVVRTLYPSTLS